MKEINVNELNTDEARARFINTAESGVYCGRTESGLFCRVYVFGGDCMRVNALSQKRGGWFVDAFYNNGGRLEGYSYEAV